MTGRSGTRDAAVELPLPMAGRVDRSASDAFDAIFVEHYPRVVNILARLVRDRQRAEQLAADVFWKLYRKSLFRPRDGEVAAWLHRVAVRVGLDALRTASRRARHEEAAATERSRSGAASGSPLDEVLIAERRAHVRSTLAVLKRRDARLLVLRASGLSYQEIAAALRVNPRSVGTLLARAEDAFERTHRRLHGEETDAGRSPHSAVRSPPDRRATDDGLRHTNKDR